MKIIMNILETKLLNAQRYAMSIRPKLGGFPYLAEVLYKEGVKRNIWSLPSCQSIYIMKEGSVVQQGSPLIEGIQQIAEFNQENLIAAIRKDQAGDSSFSEFLRSAWNAGVIGYEVDFRARNVTYYSAKGEKYIEKYPKVEVTPAINLKITNIDPVVNQHPKNK
jgi:uncharacterized protein YbcV (DUF1398 family)